MKVNASKLSFKGDNSSLKPKKVKRKIDSLEATSSSSCAVPVVNDDDDIKILSGTGRLTSSGTTVHGHFTTFMSELAVGDAVIITHPSTLLEETKIVRMVLSDMSMSLSSAFSTDLITTTPFTYIKAPKDKEQVEKELKDEQVTKQRKTEEEAFGTYASNGGETFVYRVKKTGSYGGYNIVTEKLSEAKSREDLLNMRTKKKSDRFCY